MEQIRHSRMVHISLIGDFDVNVAAHRAIPLALKRAGEDLGVDVRFTWHHTARLGARPERALEASSGVWCVPASPYANAAAALAVIRFARERPRPFLGTCGGFQHALLEYAQNVLRMANATHAELDPSAPDPLIAPLSCALVEQVEAVAVAPGSRLAAAYGATAVVEEYHCRYGLAPRHERLIEGGPLRIVGRGREGEVRAVEMDGHRFFIATLFQPERVALKERTPPLVRAFIAAAAEMAV